MVVKNQIVKRYYLTILSNTFSYFGSMTTHTTALSIKLESSYKERLGHLANAKKRTAHALAREAIQRFVEQEEVYENSRREAIASYEEYLETGLHITLDEADDWIATWGTTNEKEAPICHK